MKSDVILQALKYLVQACDNFHPGTERFNARLQITAKVPGGLIWERLPALPQGEST